jgi:hypothetical protein
MNTRNNSSNAPEPFPEEQLDMIETSETPPSDDRSFRSQLLALWSQLTLSEISGSLGDLGTFIPLYVALCRQGSLYASPALFFAGLSNVVTGFMWDLPMPVQPMKSIAAVALVEVLSREQVSAAGVWMGVFLFLLGVSNGIELVNWLVPTSVVCGMQLGVGISLAMKGFIMIADLTWIGRPDCILLAVVCALACLFFLREPDERTDDSGHGSRTKTRHRPAVGLYLFLLGGTIAVVKLIVEKDPTLSWKSHPSVWIWALSDTSWSDWKVGFLEGALPQLPLSTLVSASCLDFYCKLVVLTRPNTVISTYCFGQNSVISVCCLAHTLYPERRRQGNSETSDSVLSRREVCLSVGAMNLLLCPLGAMPNCHGAGGLAGQHKFGARHGASVIFLGINKMVIAICLGGVILPFLNNIPSSILGVMLAIAGHELACTGLIILVQSSDLHDNRDQHPSRILRTNAAVALLTAAVILGLKKTHYGAISGCVAHMIYNQRLGSWWRWRRQGEEAEADYSEILQSREGTDEIVADNGLHDHILTERDGR